MTVGSQDDRYYSFPPYLILLCATLINVTSTSFAYSCGVFYRAIVDEFGQSETKSAWLGALANSFFCLGGPVGSVFINKFGSRVTAMIGITIATFSIAISGFAPTYEFMIPFYGVGTGIGTSMAYMCSILTVNYHFENKRNVATGAVVTGSGIATMLLPVCTQICLDHFGFSTTLLILAAVSAQGCVLVAFMTPHVNEMHVRALLASQETMSKRSKWRTFMTEVRAFSSLFQNKAFLLMNASILCWSVGVLSLYLFLADYMVWRSSTRLEASYMLSVLGVGSIVSRMLTGLASNDESMDSKLLYLGSFGVLGVITLLLPFYGGYWLGKLIYCLLCGIYSAGVWVLLSIIAVDIVGFQNITNALGVEMFTAGLGFLIGPYISRTIKMHFTFDIVMVFVGSLFLLTCFCGLFMMLFIPKEVHTSRLQDLQSQREVIQGSQTSLTPSQRDLALLSGSKYSIGSLFGSVNLSRLMHPLGASLISLHTQRSATGVGSTTPLSTRKQLYSSHEKYLHGPTKPDSLSPLVTTDNKDGFTVHVS